MNLLDTVQDVETLHLEKIHDGPTEIGSLFLLPEYRGQKRGRLLSLSRFAFMAAHPKRFAEDVIAEMRGVMSEDGQCPFWEAIGKHFFRHGLSSGRSTFHDQQAIHRRPDAALSDLYQYAA